jgi:hypothetical protein
MQIKHNDLVITFIQYIFKTSKRFEDFIRDQLHVPSPESWNFTHFEKLHVWKQLTSIGKLLGYFYFNVWCINI